MDELYKFGVKLYVETTGDLALTDLIPVYHRWIQRHAVPGMLIDVADYSHVHDGPGVLLIAHEGNYGMDDTNGKRGMLYYQKRPLEGNAVERLTTVCRNALQACRLLEQDPELNGAIRFRGDRLRIIANDRLLAPNDQATQQSMMTLLPELLDNLYQGDYSMAVEPDGRERFAVDVDAAEPVSVDELLNRLAA